MNHTYDEPSLVLLSEVEARSRLAGRVLALQVLRPPYPVLGVGELRVLRVIDAGAETHVIAGYERYERLPA